METRRSPSARLALALVSMGLLATLPAVACIPAPPQSDVADAAPRDATVDAPSDVTVTPPGDAPSEAEPPRDARPDEGAPDAPPSKACPSGRGPTMVRIDAANGSFCIDATEVTNAHFNAYLNAGLTSWDVPPMCTRWKADTDKPTVVGEAALQQLPVERVSFCDGWAYCAWAGKRLCGKVGGGHSDGTDALTNEWVYACRNGTRDLPFSYGASFEPATCNVVPDAGFRPEPVAVKTGRPACHGTAAPFDGIFDMLGNVGEFDDSSSSYDDWDAGAAAPVTGGRGGSSGAVSLSGCAKRADYAGPSTRFHGQGIRCCADLR